VSAEQARRVGVGLVGIVDTLLALDDARFLAALQELPETALNGLLTGWRGGAFTRRYTDLVLERSPSAHEHPHHR
jgi:hypothetical protein